jgi:hypothetical protein
MWFDMRVDEIPPEIIDLMNERAGKIHRKDGEALTTLAEILTLYRKMVLAEVEISMSVALGGRQ